MRRRSFECEGVVSKESNRVRPLVRAPVKLVELMYSINVAEKSRLIYITSSREVFSRRRAYARAHSRVVWVRVADHVVDASPMGSA